MITETTEPWRGHSGQPKKFGESCFCGVEAHEHGFGPRCIGWVESQQKELVTTLTIRILAKDDSLDAAYRLNTSCAGALERHLQDEGYEVISIE